MGIQAGVPSSNWSSVNRRNIRAIGALALMPRPDGNQAIQQAVAVVVRGRETMAAYRARTIGAESFHLGCLLVMLPAAVYATWAGWTRTALWLTLPSIPLHVYPVLLQRYTRARMARFSPATAARRGSG